MWVLKAVPDAGSVFRCHSFTLYIFETFFAAQSFSRALFRIIENWSYHVNLAPYASGYKWYGFKILDRNFLWIISQNKFATFVFSPSRYVYVMMRPFANGIPVKTMLLCGGSTRERVWEHRLASRSTRCDKNSKLNAGDTIFRFLRHSSPSLNKIP